VKGEKGEGKSWVRLARDLFMGEMGTIGRIGKIGIIRNLRNLGKDYH
jgi:hypothetical protein